MARPAKTKEKLIALIEESQNHEWTIDQLHSELSMQGWDVTYSSVFRAVDQLEEGGYIQKLATESDKVTFEKIDKHHEHLKCDLCGSFVSLDCVFGDELYRAIELATGFEVKNHFFSGTGICKNCNDREDKR